MPLVSFVTTCMGRLAHLQRALPTWLVQPDAEIIVVDFSCPDRSGDWVAAEHPGVRVARVQGRRHFNLSAARNAGAAVASGRWLCFLDADILLAPDFGAAVFPQLEEGTYWRSEGGTTDLMGTVLVPRDAFTALDGYDEALEGWGNEDGDFYKRLRWRGVARRTYPHALMASIPHGDDQRVEHAFLRDRGVNWLVNRTYLEAKWNFMRLQERDLTLAERKNLYAHVRASVLQALEGNELPELAFSLGWQAMIPGVEVEHRFSLHLRSTT